MKYTEHKTREGKVIKGEAVIEAVKAVCEEYRKNAFELRNSDCYASHITEDQKDEYLIISIMLANDLEEGRINPTFTDWQRVNQKLTGETVALLSI